MKVKIIIVKLKYCSCCDVARNAITLLSLTACTVPSRIIATVILNILLRNHTQRRMRINSIFIKPEAEIKEISEDRQQCKKVIKAWIFFSQFSSLAHVSPSTWVREEAKKNQFLKHKYNKSVKTFFSFLCLLFVYYELFLISSLHRSSQQ